MPERHDVTTGAPVWVDLSCGNLSESTAFYCELFGWEAKPVNPDEEGYTYFTLNGKHVAGIIPSSSTRGWHVYLSVEDAEATVALAEENGAKVTVTPTSIGEAGTVAFVAEPGGSEIGLWQSDHHKGFQVVDEVGAVCWFDLVTTKVDDGFFHTLFGWECKKVPFELADGSSVEINTFLAGGKAVGTFVLRENPRGDGLPSWYVCFQVEDCKAMEEKAAALGGEVTETTQSVGTGAYAVIADPDGAKFCVVETFEPKWSDWKEMVKDS